MDSFIESDDDIGIEEELQDLQLEISSSSSSSDDISTGQSASSDSDFNPGTIQWQREPSKAIRKENWDKIRGNSGLGRVANCVKTRKQAFELFFTEAIKDEIVKWTSQKMDEERFKNEAKMEKKELDALAALLLHSGRMGVTNLTPKDLWTTSPMDKMDMYSATMSRNRFYTLLSALRFDDKSTRTERKAEDPFAPFRTVSDLFAEACREHFKPGQSLTVDERMVPYRGRVKFRIYIANKPDKYGMKLWLLVDSQNYYVLNFQPYLGKLGGQTERELGKRVVLDLVSYLGHGYKITCDNYFTSAKLGVKLLQQEKTMLGTIRSERKEVPKEMKKDKSRPVFTSRFRYSDHLTICSYVPKKNKSVILLSTGHPIGEISTEERDRMKPKMILDYNATKCGVDILDKKVKEYSTRRATRRWTMAMFYNFLDIAICNAHVVYCLSNKVNESRKDFIKKFCPLPLTLGPLGQHLSKRAKKCLQDKILLFISYFRAAQQMTRFYRCKSDSGPDGRNPLDENTGLRTGAFGPQTRAAILSQGTRLTCSSKSESFAPALSLSLSLFILIKNFILN